MANTRLWSTFAFCAWKIGSSRSMARLAQVDKFRYHLPLFRLERLTTMPWSPRR